ncbi:ribonuclease P protein subunit p30 isoform X3 [Thunnus albacares]|uniref:ribonuclease P protein subunit p30 isoform X2 n=1 Tax=Thunnus maccoyii TaxID=8240 RepID=UPI001C4BFE3F|nr:ribonuclease P protein subunit p30 isoform X2 [Thunnus maccoyii]XP_044193587.1 ribonuclease P protein subunit p30 isoform X3 [Thunnus albacares]
MCQRAAGSRSSIMSVFMDLNLNYTADKSRLQSLIETAAHLGFSTVAVNYVFEPSAKNKGIPSPTPINELIDQLPIVQGRSRPITVLNRLTIVTSDPSHFRPNAAEYRCFDLLAVQPTSEKLFHAADRGLVFEVSYAAAIRDSTMRRYTIANAVSLMESCRGKNVILSSAAEKALELRGPYDVTNLGLLFGLSDGDAKEAVSSRCRSVILHAETRKTASGVVYTVKSCQQEAPPAAAHCEAPAAKRARPHLTD